MHVGLDVSSAVRPEPMGVAVYIRQLVAALARLDGSDRFTLMHRLGRLRQWRCFLPPPAANFSRRLYIGWYHFWVARDLDVFHGLDGRLIESRFRGRRVATLHNIRSVFGPEGFAPAEFRALKARRYHELMAEADRVIVVSEALRREVQEFFSPPPEKLRVIHLAAGNEFRPREEEEVRAARERRGLASPYLMYVGAINRTKNLPRIARAFLAARRRTGSEAALAVAGPLGFGGGEILRELGLGSAPESRAAAQSGPIRILGHVGPSELAALYTGARGLLHASLYESFGMPVVEAMSCGCPVLAGEVGALPEVLNGAGMLVSPHDEEAMASRIEPLLTDEATRSGLREKGLRRARDFSWEKTAQATLEVYRELAGQKASGPAGGSRPGATGAPPEGR
jgi:glycosyltransferase involved in cell wall biosynthesis